LAKAEERWKAEETGRLDAARSEWQHLAARMLAEEADKSQKLSATLAAEADKSRKLETALEALVQARSVPASGDASQDLERLRSEMALLQATVAERDSALARRQAEMDQEREHARREQEAALEAAAKTWKTEEAARLDAATAKIRAQSQDALAEMSARCEQAEGALADARKRISVPAHADDGYIQGLRAEIAELRKSLANQEVELGWARAALDESRPLHLRRAGENLPIGNFQAPVQDEPVPAANAGSKRTIIRDCLLVAGLVVPLILFYPWIAAYLPDGVRGGIDSMTGGLLSGGTERPVAAHVAAPPPQPVQRPTATVVKSVNVHATAAVKGAVVVTLQKNASVVVLEQQGNWTHVEIPAKDSTATPQQGWVYSTYLNAKKPDNQKSDN
jgi:hypothetical protein